MKRPMSNQFLCLSAIVIVYMIKRQMSCYDRIVTILDAIADEENQ